MKKAVVRKCKRSRKNKFKVVILNENGSINRIHSYYKKQPAAAKVARELNKGIRFLRSN